MSHNNACAALPPVGHIAFIYKHECEYVYLLVWHYFTKKLQGRFARGFSQNDSDFVEKNLVPEKFVLD